MLTNGQATSFYYARKRTRDSRLAIALEPRSATIGAQTLAADTTVAQVDTLVDNGRGATTLSLSGADAADFQLDGRLVQIKSGTVLSAASTLLVTVVATNTVLGVQRTQLEVKVP